MYYWILLNCLYSSLCKQFGRISFLILGKFLLWSIALFSLPNNLFCVDTIRRIYILVNILEGLKSHDIFWV